MKAWVHRARTAVGLWFVTLSVAGWYHGCSPVRNIGLWGSAVLPQTFEVTAEGLYRGMVRWRVPDQVAHQLAIMLYEGGSPK